MSRLIPAILVLAAMVLLFGCGSPQGGAGTAPAATSSGSGSSAPAAASPAAPAPPPPRTATFDAGAPLTVRTTSAMDTRGAKDGDRWMGTLEKPLQSGEWVVAPKGATVSGTVVHSDPGGRVKGRASITIAITGLELADGRTVSLSTTRVGRVAASSVKKDVVRTGIASGVGAAIGAIAGGGKGAAIGAGAGAAGGTGVAVATRGDPARIPAESVLTFKLSAPLTITEKR